jgi:hypothetical protein
MTREDEAFLASVLARPEWPRIRALLIELGLSVKPLDELIARVRREVWRDFS